MRSKRKQKILIFWTFLISVLIFGILLHFILFPTGYMMQLKMADCVPVSSLENNYVKTPPLSVHSNIVSQYPFYIPMVFETRQNYVVIPNYIDADNKYEANETITLTTQGTKEFLYHIVEQCRRWKAPLSVAVYSPGSDFISTVSQIIHMRRCNDPCVRSNVSWHLIYDINHPPSKIPLFLTERENESTDCKNYPKETISYRKKMNLSYPINVARNVARLQARTHYVFALDIELYPSSNVVLRFLKFVKTQKHSKRNVFVLPVFEIAQDQNPPTTKRVLVSMLRKGKANFFHKYVCDICHRFPKRTEWIKTIQNENHLGVFTVTKRKKPWEPFYIGTNEEPIFDERFTWEGKMNKMPQVYEMCLLNYDFSILDNAFLVHAPGIKKYSASAESWRNKYARKNYRFLKSLTSTLQKAYNITYDC